MSSYDLDPLSNPERKYTKVTAGELCGVFGLMGEELMDSGRAQYLGNDICTYNGPLTITNRRQKQGRVTHVKLTGKKIGDNYFPVTHEIHFPSKDSAAKDYTVAKAIFVTHEYDENGERVASYPRTMETVDLRDPETAAFMGEIEEAYVLARADFSQIRRSARLELDQ